MKRKRKKGKERDIYRMGKRERKKNNTVNILQVVFGKKCTWSEVKVALPSVNTRRTVTPIPNTSI